jgi:hypothetical protein
LPAADEVMSEKSASAAFFQCTSPSGNYAVDATFARIDRLRLDEKLSL